MRANNIKKFIIDYNVDIKTYEKFSMAESQGKALNEHIKNTEIKATKVV